MLAAGAAEGHGQPAPTLRLVAGQDQLQELLNEVEELRRERLIEDKGADLWIVDTLRRRPHPTHPHLDQALGWIRTLQPARALLTHMHIPLDYETVCAETPDNVDPAFDGMNLELEYNSTGW